VLRSHHQPRHQGERERERSDVEAIHPSIHLGINKEDLSLSLSVSHHQPRHQREREIKVMLRPDIQTSIRESMKNIYLFLC